LRGLAQVAAVLFLGGCQLPRPATPLAPDPSISLAGRWTIVAVNGRNTGGGERFDIEFRPEYGVAQFGCNEGSGTYRVESGWLVIGDWIITAAGCPGKQQFERPGFAVLGKPLAVERHDGGVRLRGAHGSIHLVR
jgi:heat shock protein HslJ